MPEPWSRSEVELVVDDYLHMLMQELAGQAYSKTRHRQALTPKLQDRSDGSIELKHQNISAVLIQLGCPWISGYKPRFNYQQLLEEVIEARVRLDEKFNRTARSAIELPAAAPLINDIQNIVVPPPEFDPTAPVVRHHARSPGVFRDYLVQEANNRSLGAAGEDFVLAFERARLLAQGSRKLVDRVEHVSRTKGDGLGYDILSFEASGKERFIEVKTTAFGKQTPFFISRNEVEFSEAFRDQFHLYRVFEFRRTPKIFDLEGAVRSRCRLDPETYVGRFS